VSISSSESVSTTKKRVLSGMRPTGKLHLGNYMGALYNWVRLQHEYECYFFIADWHALTTDYADPSQLPKNSREVALDFLAAGLDPEKCTIFVQSHVKQHAELHALLSMITPLSWLERVPSYKDQQEQLKEKDLATYGFLGYPLLQTADILIYQPDFVPVGQDQVAHVELTREIARRFNAFYGESIGFGSASKPDWGLVGKPILPEPKVLLTPSPKLPGTDGRKMSKSYGNTILLTDSADTVLEKLRNMYNGGQRSLLSDPGNPDICPVSDLHKIFSTAQIYEETRSGCTTASISCVECKRLAASSVNKEIKPIQTQRSYLELNPHIVDGALHDGAKKAAKRAEHTMTLVRDAMGLNLKKASYPMLIAFDQMQQNSPGIIHHNLSNFADWWNDDITRGDKLREYWKTKMLPSDVTVKTGDKQVFITAKNKRLFVPTACEEDGKYKFNVRNKSYEVLVLLAWQVKDYILRAFVVPQKEYRSLWSHIDKVEKRFDLSLFNKSGQYILQFPTGDQINVTHYDGDYSSIR
jgi:tryptophanyl-tRNA synthetase